MQTKKVVIILVGVLSVINSTLGSALPSNDAGPLAEHFHVTHQLQLVLPNSIYLIGYIFGPLILAPASETIGRQIVMIGTFLGFLIFTFGICWAPNWPAFIIFRLIKGVFASSPISVTGGIFADLTKTAKTRGRSMALFMTATSWGPLVSPIISGYLSPYGWQWPFYAGLIIASASIIPIALLPETYAPVILQRRARKIRKADPTANVWAPIELQETSFKDAMITFLGRPLRMIFREPLVQASCLYLGLVYAVIYMFFEAFILIFPPIYGFSLGEEGLAFLGIGVGSIFACGIYLWWDGFLDKAKAQGKPWSHSEEFRRLPLACIGGPFFTIGLFWIGWAARPSVHWIVPILGGVPLGIGYLLLFMSFINYLVDAYAIFAASALAASSCTRAIFGACLPFATDKMYKTLGIAWACSLLGFVSLAMAAIPFIFIRYGEKLRSRSKFCQELAEITDRENKEQLQNDMEDSDYPMGEEKV